MTRNLKPEQMLHSWIGKEVILDLVDITVKGTLMGFDSYDYVIHDGDTDLVINKRDTRAVVLYVPKLDKPEA